jgi:hypothetical protein
MRLCSIFWDRQYLPSKKMPLRTLERSHVFLNAKYIGCQPTYVPINIGVPKCVQGRQLLRGYGRTSANFTFKNKLAYLWPRVIETSANKIYVPKLFRWAQLEIARSPGQEQISYLFKVLHRTKRELGLKCHFSLRFEKKLNEQSNVPVCQIKFAVELVSEIYPKLSPSTICSTSLHTGLV